MRILVALLSVYFANANADELQRYAVKFRAAADKWAPVASLDESGTLIPARVLRDIRIEFGDVFGKSDVEGRHAAQCQLSETQHATVHVDKEYWEKLDEWTKEMLIFHELGHCLLHRDHDTREITRNGHRIPKSIMRPVLFDSDTYLLNRDYYLEELFHTLLTVPETKGTELHE